MANDTYQPLVTLTTLSETFSYVNYALPPSWHSHLSSTRLRYHSKWPGEPTTRPRSLTKISQHENSTVHPNIKVVSWITECKQDKLSRVASNSTSITYLFWYFFYGLTASVGLGLLIFEALWSHSGVPYAELLTYTLVVSEFTSSF